MADVTQLLDAAAAGNREAAADLLPLVYDELRRLAAARLADEPAGNTGITDFTPLQGMLLEELISEAPWTPITRRRSWWPAGSARYNPCDRCP